MKSEISIFSDDKNRSAVRAAFFGGVADGICSTRFLADSQDVAIALGSLSDDHVRAAKTRSVVRTRMNRIYGRALAAKKG